MFSEFSYPIICAKDFVKTVNFYEDYFDFEVALEMDSFTILKRKDMKDMYLAVIDSTHETIPVQYRQPTKGMILNFPVSDVEEMYETIYLEGLNIISEPSDAPCGRKHFFVEGPNGSLINVAQNIPLEDLIKKEKMEEVFVVV